MTKKDEASPPLVAGADVSNDLLLPVRQDSRDIVLADGGFANRKCTATAKSTGKRCDRPPILGGYVCKHHGGGSEDTKAAARHRLLALVDPAINALTTVLKMTQACDACGGMMGDAKLMAVIVKASQLVLDRCGYAPKKEVEVTIDAGAWVQYLTDEQLQTVQGWVAEAKMRAAQDSVIVDAELVDEEDVGE